jgi:hypothetical protein
LAAVENRDENAHRNHAPFHLHVDPSDRMPIWSPRFIDHQDD